MIEPYNQKAKYHIQANIAANQDATYFSIRRYVYHDNGEISQQYLRLNEDKSWDWAPYQGYDVIEPTILIQGHSGNAFLAAIEEASGVKKVKLV